MNKIITNSFKCCIKLLNVILTNLSKYCIKFVIKTNNNKQPSQNEFRSRELKPMLNS